ncbi:MAG: sulfite exporter TauE/SafE family protein [Phycisphaerae bacterium]|nr:sulfite exporter TauE/SafE family protein [Phycisphaerae bacterium]
MDATQYLFLIMLGMVAGGSGGLLGIGGSLVMIPGMILMFGAEGQHPNQEPQHLYQAAAMIVNFFVVAPAVVRHYHARATLKPVVRLTIPSAVLGAVAGVYVSELPAFRGSGQGFLQITFSLFLFYVVIHNLWKLRPGQAAHEARGSGRLRLSKPLIVTLVGLPTGLVGGLLGIGGGLFAVPAQQVVLRVPLRNAIANSATTILWSSIIGAALKNYHLAEHGFSVGQSVKLAICLIPSAMVGSWFTSARVHRWPIGVIRLAFVVLLLYCGVRVFLAGLSQVHP